jgi:hypothetical protein
VSSGTRRSLFSNAYALEGTKSKNIFSAGTADSFLHDILLFIH